MINERAPMAQSFIRLRPPLGGGLYIDWVVVNPVICPLGIDRRTS
jgi:hypothetical protein